MPSSLRRTETRGEPAKRAASMTKISSPATVNAALPLPAMTLTLRNAAKAWTAFGSEVVSAAPMPSIRSTSRRVGPVTVAPRAAELDAWGLREVLPAVGKDWTPGSERRQVE